MEIWGWGRFHESLPLPRFLGKTEFYGYWSDFGDANKCLERTTNGACPVVPHLQLNGLTHWWPAYVIYWPSIIHQRSTDLVQTDIFDIRFSWIHWPVTCILNSTKKQCKSAKLTSQSNILNFLFGHGVSRSVENRSLSSNSKAVVTHWPTLSRVSIYGSDSAGRGKSLFYVLFFLSRASVWLNLLW